MKENNEPANETLENLILKSLSHMKRGSADEIAMEIMEIRGISSEEGVAELIIETKRELGKMEEMKLVEKIKPHGEKSRYILCNG